MWTAFDPGAGCVESLVRRSCGLILGGLAPIVLATSELKFRRFDLTIPHVALVPAWARRRQKASRAARRENLRFKEW